MRIPLPSPIEQLIEDWQSLARLAEIQLRDSHKAEMIRSMVAQLQEAIQAELDRLLASEDAEAFSHTTRDTLRRTVENRGAPYRPAYRAGDLPVKRGAPSISRLPRILQLMTEKVAGGDDARREQIRQQARETARRSHIA